MRWWGESGEFRTRRLHVSRAGAAFLQVATWSSRLEWPLSLGHRTLSKQCQYPQPESMRQVALTHHPSLFHSPNLSLRSWVHNYADKRHGFCSENRSVSDLNLWEMENVQRWGGRCCNIGKTGITRYTYQLGNTFDDWPSMSDLNVDWATQYNEYIGFFILLCFDETL